MSLGKVADAKLGAAMVAAAFLDPRLDLALGSSVGRHGPQWERRSRTLEAKRLFAIRLRWASCWFNAPANAVRSFKQASKVTEYQDRSCTAPRK